ncbi:MAG: hypothetical protein HRU75_06715 [Planctomycetia bacterium]|nr:MAG: hypothetical protein HRU75_06715 [Planctomycetia bacterium]
MGAEAIRMRLIVRLVAAAILLILLCAVVAMPTLAGREGVLFALVLALGGTLCVAVHGVGPWFAGGAGGAVGVVAGVALGAAAAAEVEHRVGFLLMGSALMGILGALAGAAPMPLAAGPAAVSRRAPSALPAACAGLLRDGEEWLGGDGAGAHSIDARLAFLREAMSRRLGATDVRLSGASGSARAAAAGPEPGALFPIYRGGKLVSVLRASGGLCLEGVDGLLHETIQAIWLRAEDSARAARASETDAVSGLLTRAALIQRAIAVLGADGAGQAGVCVWRIQDAAEAMTRADWEQVDQLIAAAGQAARRRARSTDLLGRLDDCRLVAVLPLADRGLSGRVASEVTAAITAALRAQGFPGVSAHAVEHGGPGVVQPTALARMIQTAALRLSDLSVGERKAAGHTSPAALVIARGAPWSAGAGEAE